MFVVYHLVTIEGRGDAGVLNLIDACPLTDSSKSLLGLHPTPAALECLIK